MQLRADVMQTMLIAAVPIKQAPAQHRDLARAVHTKHSAGYAGGSVQLLAPAFFTSDADAMATIEPAGIV